MTHMQGEELSLASRAVLIVEDQYLIALDLESILTGAGAQVTIAGSCAQALALLRDRPPDMALVDINLGTESSEPVTRALHELGIAYVMSTGYGPRAQTPEDIIVLNKPYRPAEVLDALLRAWNARRQA